MVLMIDKITWVCILFCIVSSLVLMSRSGHGQFPQFQDALGLKCSQEVFNEVMVSTIHTCMLNEYVRQ